MVPVFNYQETPHDLSARECGDEWPNCQVRGTFGKRKATLKGNPVRREARSAGRRSLIVVHRLMWEGEVGVHSHLRGCFSFYF